MSPRLYIFAGRFGSGKTEASVNFALQLAQGRVLTPTGWADAPPGFNSHATLIDLDIVTPYFRSRELREILHPFRVQVVSPAGVGQYLDLPAISPEILGAIERSDGVTVVDVGGDPQGARALGQYSAAIASNAYTAYFMVNPYRFFTDTVEGVRRAVRDIERTSRIEMTALVSNPNLIDETTPEVILSGHERVLEAAEAVGLPVALLCVEARLVDELRPLAGDVPILPIQRFFDWQRTT